MLGWANSKPLVWDWVVTELVSLPALLHLSHQGQPDCAAQERGRVTLLSTVAGKENLRIFTSKLDCLFSVVEIKKQGCGHVR